MFCCIQISCAREVFQVLNFPDCITIVSGSCLASRWSMDGRRRSCSGGRPTMMSFNWWSATERYRWNIGHKSLMLGTELGLLKQFSLFVNFLFVFSVIETLLTHWGQVLTIISSDNGLLSGQRQAIIWTNAGILLSGPTGTHFREFLIEIYVFSVKNAFEIVQEICGHFVSASMC